MCNTRPWAHDECLQRLRAEVPFSMQLGAPSSACSKTVSYQRQHGNHTSRAGTPFRCSCNTNPCKQWLARSKLKSRTSVLNIGGITEAFTLAASGGRSMQTSWEKRTNMWTKRYKSAPGHVTFHDALANTRAGARSVLRKVWASPTGGSTMPRTAGHNKEHTGQLEAATILSRACYRLAMTVAISRLGMAGAIRHQSGPKALTALGACQSAVSPVRP